MSDSELKPKSGKRKWLKWAIICLLVLIVAAVVTVTMVAKNFLTADALVAKFEGKYNCRLQIGDFKVSGLTGTTRIELTDISLAERDEVADAGTPHSERTQVVGGVLLIQSATLEANATDLLKKIITLKDVSISGLSYYSVIQTDGSHRLDPLFEPPVKINGAANPKFEEQMRRRDEAKARRKMKPEERKKQEAKEFNAAELPMAATMQSLRISNSNIELKLRKTKNRISIRDIDLELSELDIDPADLKYHNSAKLKFTAAIDLEDNDRTVKYAELKISSDGTVTPFDEITGDVNPDISYDITMHAGSRIEEVPALVKAGKEKLQKYGVSVEEIGRNLVMEKDTTMKLAFFESELHTVADFEIFFSGHQLMLAKGSWWNSGSNLHEIPGSILISKEITAKARGQAEEFLAAKYGLNQELVTTIADVLLAPVSRDDRLWMPFVSSGDFSRPKVDVPWEELQDAADLIKDEAKGKAMELLDGLLGE